jgi:hypothetical protein
MKHRNGNGRVTERTRRRSRAALAGLLLAVPVAGLAESWTLSADDWARPRGGEMLLSLEPVAAAAEAWVTAPERRLVLVYPGGESGEIWAAELRDWLAAMGVDPRRIEMHAGSAADGGDRLVLRLR